MASGMKKIKIMAGTAFMITMISSNAHAFGIPLLSADMQRLVTSVKVTMNEIMIIKQEVESNLKIIEEIRNGGFASAGAMIFDKIQNGDYDRFGQSLKNVRNEGLSAADNVKARKKYKEFEEQARKDGLSEKEAKAKAQQQVAEYLDQERADRLKKQQEARDKRAGNAFNKSYNWLKNNQAVTSGASSALRGVDSDNWGQVLSGAAGVTGGAIGDKKAGDAFSNASYSAGNALNSALSGNWSDFAASTSQATGGAVSGATGSQGFGNVIAGVGTVGAGISDVAGAGGDWGQVIANTANNSRINSGLDSMGSGYNQMDAANKQAAAEEAEANRKAGEEIRRKNQEAFDQYQKNLLEQQQGQPAMSAEEAEAVRNTVEELERKNAEANEARAEEERQNAILESAKEAARKAEEAAKKAEEEAKAKALEQQKQQRCNECILNLMKEGASENEAGKKCVSTCNS